MSNTPTPDTGEFAGHTPGPWHWVDPETDIPIDYEERDPRLTEAAQDSRIVNVSLRTTWEERSQSSSFYLPKFLINHEDDISKADARLIAAAPRLIQERDRYKLESDTFSESLDRVLKERNDACAALDQLRAEKAELLTTLAKIKLKALTCQNGPGGLATITRLCIDAGITEKLGAGLEERAALAKHAPEGGAK